MKVPRELMVMSDGLLRKKGVKYPECARAQDWAYYLRGLPVFKISQTEEALKIMGKFGKPDKGEGRAGKYYVQIDPEMKISALVNLQRALNPKTVYVPVRGFCNKPKEVQRALTEITGNEIFSDVDGWSVVSTQSDKPDANGTILVLFDVLAPKYVLSRHVQMTVIFSSKEDRAGLGRVGAKELSASSLIHFKGVLPPR